MKKFVETHGIAMLKADKTTNPPEIDDLLIRLGNTTKQIPFYAIFPAGRANQPVVMDGLYASPQAFIDKLKEVGAGKQTVAEKK